MRDAQLLPDAIAPLKSGNVNVIDRCVPPCELWCFTWPVTVAGATEALRQQPTLAMEPNEAEHAKRGDGWREHERQRDRYARARTAVQFVHGGIGGQVAHVDRRSDLQGSAAIPGDLPLTANDATVHAELVADPTSIVTVGPQPRDDAGRRHALRDDRAPLSGVPDSGVVHPDARADRRHEQHDGEDDERAAAARERDVARSRVGQMWRREGSCNSATSTPSSLKFSVSSSPLVAGAVRETVVA